MVKLIKQGGGGYTIYLPKKWVDKNRFEKGTELSIEESGNNLVISPGKIIKKQETEISLVTDTETSIRTLITNSYRTGYDKIKINFNSDSQFKILQKIVKSNLIGFDIIKKENNSCIVENITEPDFDQFDNLLKKMFMNIDELFNVTNQKLSNSIKNTEDFNEVEERILRYDNFCRRVISKQKLIKKNSELFWTFLSLIIHGQRELFHLNKLLNKEKISKNILDLLDDSYKIYKLIEEAYYKKDINILSKIHDLNKHITKTTYSLLEKSKGKENIFIFHISNSAHQFYLSNSPLSGLLI